MKRPALVLGFTLVLATALFGAGTTTTHHSSDKVQSVWVLVERNSPYDVNANCYTTAADVKTRMDTVNKDNADRAKENKDINAEISKLTGQLSAKKTKLAETKDETAKADLQKEVDDLKGQIDAKKGEIKPIVKLDTPKEFKNQADADKYIELVLKQAQEAKDKADKAAEKAAEKKK